MHTFSGFISWSIRQSSTSVLEHQCTSEASRSQYLHPENQSEILTVSHTIKDEPHAGECIACEPEQNSLESGTSSKYVVSSSLGLVLDNQLFQCTQQGKQCKSVTDNFTKSTY